MSAHRLPTLTFRRAALAIGTVAALTAGSLAAAWPATATTPPNPGTTLLNSIEAQIAKAENNPKLQSTLDLLNEELYQVEWFIQSDCTVNIVMALLGDWYGPVCPGSSL